MQHDSQNPEDLDTDNEDHAVDALRYLCMHTSENLRKQPVKSPFDELIDEILGNQIETEYARRILPKRENYTEKSKQYYEI